MLLLMRGLCSRSVDTTSRVEMCSCSKDLLTNEGKQGVIRPPGSKMGIIEAVWKPDEVVEEAAEGEKMEVEGVKAVLEEGKDGAKVVSAEDAEAKSAGKEE